jgi:hypothetical protein
VLVVMAGLLVLLGGLMVIVGLEERSAQAHSNALRAELAARSALSELRTVLKEETAGDDYVVIRSAVEVAHDDNESGRVDSDERGERPYLFLARGEKEGGAVTFAYEPLFTTETKPDETELLTLPDEHGLPENAGDRVSLTAVPHEMPPVLGWRYIDDEDGRMVARYAYWVEDMEAYIDPAVAGNARLDDRHARTAELWPDQWPDDIGEPLPYAKNGSFMVPFHAPGINPATEDGAVLDQIALHALDEKQEQEDESEFDDRLREARDLFLTDDSLLAAMEVPAPLQRDEDGHLLDEVGRRIEENLAALNQPYLERALVPPGPGVDPSLVGEPKLNLNRLLQETPSGAVDEIARQIGRAFPDFTSRQGGFQEDYLRTLAANIVDYADRDSEGTLQEDAYRGIDAYPFTSEFLLRYKWEWEGDPYSGQGVITENGRKYVLLTVAAYAELWNMCNHPVSGTVEYEYETRFNLSLGAVPQINLMDEVILNRPVAAINPRAAESGATHELEKDDAGRWFFPPQGVELQPNEYRIVKLGDVRYKLDAGLSFLWVASPSQLEGDHGQSGYHMKWNGQLVDRAFGDLERPDVSLNYPANSQSQPRQKVRGTIPGHSYGEYGLFHNGMGDPRIAFYANEMQSLSAYPRNFSPWRRNVRLAIFRSNPNAIYGRVIPSEWPDGGHDSDDPRFVAGKPEPEPLKAPMRISNLGRFFSETELGHIWDPVMWGSKRDPVTGAGLPRLAIEAWTKEVKPENFPSGSMGGGSTLRIGRPEHQSFDEPGLRASGLLDLFHCGIATSEEREEREGAVVLRRGHVNLNTAPRDVLRALAAGMLVHDPAMARVISPRPSAALKAPPTTPYEAGVPTAELAADILADEIIRNRPYVSPSQLALVEDGGQRVVFGNNALYSAGSRLQWSDAAAEEAFARVYNSTTVRSRNFRVHVIGQALREIGDSDVKVLATRRKIFRVFSDPGERDADGTIDTEKHAIEVIYERDS